MRNMWRAALGLLISVTALTGCNNSLKEENALLLDENQMLRAELDDRNRAMETTNMDLRDLQSENAALRQDLQAANDRIADANRAPVDPFSGIPGVTGSVGAGEVTARMASDVLFDSGKATLKSSAKRSLDEVARILNSDYSGRMIRVGGHTDTDPIKKSGHKSNYHLGFERAFAVRDYLVSRGVPSDRIYLASYGPDRALSSKKESRRVEIAVVLNE